MEKLKFSIGSHNKKLAKLEKLTGKKVYSLSTLSGTNCPGAQSCLAKVIIKDGRRKLEHGKAQQFTCFSSVEEVAFTNVYKARKHNSDLILGCKTENDLVELIKASFPKDCQILRWHVAGDWMSQKHFNAGLRIAKLYPEVIFYSYTKSLPFWVAKLDEIPDNFVLTASVGGRWDSMIEKHGLRKAVVVFSEQEAQEQNLEIDYTDFAAYNPLSRSVNIGLLIHGVQKAGSKSAEALKKLNRAKKNEEKL